MRRRSFVHRMTALLSSALLLQLSMLASGTRCRMHGGHETAASAQGAVAAHAGHGSDVASTDAQNAVRAAEQSPSAGCDQFATGACCNTPWSASGCTSMSTCVAVSSMAPPVRTLVDRAVTPALRFVASAAIPLGPALVPDPPPPRA